MCAYALETSHQCHIWLLLLHIIGCLSGFLGPQWYIFVSVGIILNFYCCFLIYFEDIFPGFCSFILTLSHLLLLSGAHFDCTDSTISSCFSAGEAFHWIFDFIDQFFQFCHFSLKFSHVYYHILLNVTGYLFHGFLNFLNTLNISSLKFYQKSVYKWLTLVDL